MKTKEGSRESVEVESRVRLLNDVSSFEQLIKNCSIHRLKNKRVQTYKEAAS